MTLKIGDVVRLKSGSPKLTVVQFMDSPGLGKLAKAIGFKEDIEGTMKEVEIIVPPECFTTNI